MLGRRAEGWDALGGCSEGSLVFCPSFGVHLSLKNLIKNILVKARDRHGVRSTGWSPARRAWWVASRLWPEVREALMEAGVVLHGKLTHPLRRRRGHTVY